MQLRQPSKLHAQQTQHVIALQPSQLASNAAKWTDVTGCSPTIWASTEHGKNAVPSLLNTA
jgi:hypothetical protein